MTTECHSTENHKLQIHNNHERKKEIKTTCVALKLKWGLFVENVPVNFWEVFVIPVLSLQKQVLLNYSEKLESTTGNGIQYQKV
jgi:hypothetical protein